MKPCLCIMSALLLSGMLAAQAAAPAQDTGSAQQSGPAMHQQHMQQMKEHVVKMRSAVDQMKANAAKIKDPAARQHAELDAQMWGMMVDHMEAMQKMMAEHPGMMGNHMRGGMHHHGPPPAPNSPGQSPTPPPPPSSAEPQ